MAGIASYVQNELLGGPVATGAPDYLESSRTGGVDPITGLPSGSPINTAQNIVNNILFFEQFIEFVDNSEKSLFLKFFCVGIIII